MAGVILVGGAAVEQATHQDTEEDANKDDPMGEVAKVPNPDAGMEAEFVESGEVITVDSAFIKMHRSRPIEEYAGKTPEERRALMDEIIEESCSWIAEHYSQEEADLVREMAQHLSPGLDSRDTGPIDLEHALEVLVNNFQADRSQTS